MDRRKVREWLHRNTLEGDEDAALTLRQAVETESWVCEFNVERAGESLRVTSYAHAADVLELEDDAELHFLLDLLPPASPSGAAAWRAVPPQSQRMH